MFIEGDIPVKVTKKHNILKSKKESRIVYMLMQRDPEDEYNPGQIFNDYKKARKSALSMVKRINNIIEKNLPEADKERGEMLLEKSPDLWSNGNRMIRIDVMEVKNS